MLCVNNVEPLRVNILKGECKMENKQTYDTPEMVFEQLNNIMFLRSSGDHWTDNY